MRITILLLLVNTFFFSCQNHSEVIDVSFQVGNILCDDGSVIHPTLYDESGKKAVGVIFWTNKGIENISDYGYAVSIEDLEAGFLIENEENITDVTADEKLFDGASNTAAFRAYSIAEDVLSPAIDNVQGYAPFGVNGWFIPSVAQMRALSQNKTKVYSTLKKIGGDVFSGWYWTCTEDSSTDSMYVLAVAINEGRFTPVSKKKIFNLRPIIAIR